MYTRAKPIKRNQIPENIGRPANSCATPTVNGLHTPAEKPQPIASKLIPKPTSESHPKRIASATTIGTSGTASSKEPMNVRNQILDIF